MTQNADAWVACDDNRHPHPATDGCLHPQKPHKSEATWLIKQAEKAEERSRRSAEQAAIFRAVAAQIDSSETS